MPKKYRVDMNLVLVEGTGDTQVESDTHTEFYDDETKAREGFQDKVGAAREKGKGKGQGQGPG